MIKVIDSLRPLQFNEGEIIINENDKISHLYLIEDVIQNLN